ncbi:MAG: transposase [Chitinophagaceae bacterium]|nr:transposase [Chitinophagaceae bacterium]
MQLVTEQRKSYIEPGNIYFWTATINNWQKLLFPEEPKKIIIDSLAYLSANRKIEVYGFVIMPNHIHLIWKTIEKNGKETPQGSFLKFTAHAFKKYLLSANPGELSNYAVTAHNKNYEFWQRDSLAIQLYTIEIAYQKLDYIHFNPVAEHWKLCTDPIAYYYSSARFYETSKDDFGFLKHLGNEF